MTCKKNDVDHPNEDGGSDRQSEDERITLLEEKIGEMIKPGGKTNHSSFIREDIPPDTKM